MKKSKIDRHLKAKNKRSPLPQAVTFPKPAVPLADENYQHVFTGNTLRNLKAFAEVGDPDVDERYSALAGCGPSLQLVSSNLVEIGRIREDVGRAIETAAQEPGMQIAMQAELLGRISGSCPMLDIKRMKKRSQVFHRIGVSSFTALAFIDVPDFSDPAGFAIEVHARSLLYGVRIDQDIALMKRTRRASTVMPETTTEWLDIQDEAALKEAVKFVITPPLVGSQLSRDAADEAGVHGWMKSASRRAYVLFQLLSLLPLKHRLSARGNGDPVLNGALMSASSRIRQSAKGTEIPLHRDAVVHHWFRENARLKLDDLTVPLLILH